MTAPRRESLAAVVLLAAIWPAPLWGLIGWPQIGWYTVLPAAVLWVWGRQLAHPASWLTFVLSLYSTFYPMHRAWLGTYDAAVQYSLFLHGVALSAFVLTIAVVDIVSAPSARESRVAPERLSAGVRRYPTKSIDVDSLVAGILAAVFFVGTVAFLTEIASLGVGTKREIRDNFSDPVLYMGYASFLPLTILLVFSLLRHWGRTTFERTLVMLAAAWFLLAYGMSGERDIVFRLGFVLVLALFDLRREFRRFYYLAGLAVLLVILPVTQAMKAVLIAGELPELFRAPTLFVGEFISSSRTLSALITAGVEPFQISPLFWDIERFLGISFDGGSVRGTASWFNNVFRVEEGLASPSGWGFSMVGFWYLCFGIAGVVLGYTVFGLVCVALFRMRGRNTYWYTFYIFFAASLAYTQRADLANLLSLVIKFTWIPLLTVWMASNILRGAATRPEAQPSRFGDPEAA